AARWCATASRSPRPAPIACSGRRIRPRPGGSSSGCCARRSGAAVRASTATTRRGATPAGNRGPAGRRSPLSRSRRTIVRMADTSTPHSPGFLALVKDAKSRVREIDVQQYRRMHDENRTHLLVDVREDNEWAAGHVKGAVHIGKGVIERDIEKL